MPKKLKTFLREFKAYAALPEMRLFWLFLALVLIVLIINFFYLPKFWQIASIAIFIVVGGFIFWNNIRTAKAIYSLKTERQRLDNIFANLPDGLVAYDPDFKILSINQAACRIFGINPEEVLGQYFSIERSKEPKFRLLTQTLFPSLAPTVIKRSEPGAYPQVIDISIDEPPLELRITTTRIINENMVVISYVKMIRNRTREVALLKSKMDFIAVTSHQLRTPLTGINWTFEALKENAGIPASLKDLINEGAQTTAKLSKIVNDLLDVAKMEEGKFGYQFQNVDVINYLEQAVSQAQPIAKEYKINIYFKRPAEEKIILSMDPTKLGMALSNMIDNAIKYNVTSGEVVVAVEKLPKEPFVQISIKDTGIGIEPEDMNKLFTKFFRSEKAIKLITAGSGMGLYIAKNIITRHGGKIWAESTINRGTTFYFTLPTDPKLIPSKEVGFGEE